MKLKDGIVKSMKEKAIVRKAAAQVKKIKSLKSLQAEFILKEKRFTNEDRVNAGFDPVAKKKKSWKTLTEAERESILSRSKAHYDRQVFLGIPEKDIYGPWAVLEKNAHWEESNTNSSLSR